MDSATKRKIRIIADRYNHSIEYVEASIVFKSTLDSVEVYKPDKYGTIVKYTSSTGPQKIKIKDLDLSSFLIDLLSRENLDGEFGPQGIITSEYYLEHEGRSLSNDLDRIKKEAIKPEFDHSDCGGNQFYMEHYKGFVIARGKSIMGCDIFEI